MEIRIEVFQPEHAPAFDALNRAWLVDHGLLEPADEEHLTDPWNSILVPGGQIFVAIRDEEVIGTCAVVPQHLVPLPRNGDTPGGRVAEIVKLVVAPAARGQGLGRRLVAACLAHARQHGVRRVVLLSSTRLGSALKLYEAMGFQHRPLPPDIPYATADVYMEMELAEPAG